MEWPLKSKVRLVFFYAVTDNLTSDLVLMRIGATSNIAKITKSMKMVSAAKMRGAENRLVAGRPFAVHIFYSNFYSEVSNQLYV